MILVFAGLLVPHAAHAGFRFTRDAPIGLRWTQAQNGWSLGVPNHRMTFTWKRPMHVTVAVKNVSDRLGCGLFGMFSALRFRLTRTHAAPSTHGL